MAPPQHATAMEMAAMAKKTHAQEASVQLAAEEFPSVMFADLYSRQWAVRSGAVEQQNSIDYFDGQQTTIDWVSKPSLESGSSEGPADSTVPDGNSPEEEAAETSDSNLERPEHVAPPEACAVGEILLSLHVLIDVLEEMRVRQNMTTASLVANGTL